MFMESNNNKTKIVIIGFLFLSIFHFFYSISVINDGHNWGGDFALYISQAKAIVNGTTNTLFEASKASCEGSFERMNPDVYPVIFPLMLSPIYVFWGLNFLAFKVLVICCFIISLAAICIFVYKKIGEFEALLVVGLLATSEFFIGFNNYVLADIPAMMWVWISIIIYMFFDESSTKLKLIKFALLGLVLAIAFQTKTLSISVIVAVLLAELFNYLHTKNSFKELVLKSFTFISVFGVVFMLIYLVYPSASSGYIQQSSKLTVPIIKSNFSYYTNAPSWFLYHSSAFVWLTLPAVILGFFYQFKKNIFIVILPSVHMLLLVLWPFQEGLRFLIFLVPLYYYFAIIGYNLFFKFLSQKIKFPNLYSIRFIVLVAIFFFSLFNNYRLYSKNTNNNNEIESAEANELFKFVNTQTNINDQFIFFKPNVLRLICNRESVYLLNSSSIKLSKASYWIFKKGDKMADTTGLKMVLNNNEFLVFKLK